MPLQGENDLLPASTWIHPSASGFARGTVPSLWIRDLNDGPMSEHPPEPLVGNKESNHWARGGFDMGGMEYSTSSCSHRHSQLWPLLPGWLGFGNCYATWQMRIMTRRIWESHGSTSMWFQRTFARAKLPAFQIFSNCLSQLVNPKQSIHRELSLAVEPDQNHFATPSCQHFMEKAKLPNNERKAINSTVLGASFGAAGWY